MTLVNFNYPSVFICRQSQFLVYVCQNDISFEQKRDSRNYKNVSTNTIQITWFSFSVQVWIQGSHPSISSVTSPPFFSVRSLYLEDSKHFLRVVLLRALNSALSRFENLKFWKFLTEFKVDFARYITFFPIANNFSIIDLFKKRVEVRSTWALGFFTRKTYLPLKLTEGEILFINFLLPDFLDFLGPRKLLVGSGNFFSNRFCD